MPAQLWLTGNAGWNVSEFQVSWKGPQDVTAAFTEAPSTLALVGKRFTEVIAEEGSKCNAQRI